METADNIITPCNSYEQEFLGFEIYIEPNPDKWQQGFVWAICKGSKEIETGLSFSIEDAVNEAKVTVELTSSA